VNARPIPTSKNSSRRYAVDWVPTRHARFRVLVGAWLLTLAGFVLVLNMRLPPALAAAIAVTWLACAIRAIVVQSVAIRDLRNITLHADGTVSARTRDDSVRMQLAPGSLVLGRYAWLRFGGPRHRRFGVLVSAAELGPTGWRRLNLFWRHGLIR
jgi:hypothetical protein